MKKVLSRTTAGLVKGFLILCLAIKYPLISYVFIVFLVTFSGMTALYVITLKKSTEAEGIRPDGNMGSSVLCILIFIILLIVPLPIVTANILLLVSMAVMLFSFCKAIYFYRKTFIRTEEETLKNIKNRRYNRKFILASIVIACILYLIAGAVLPYAEQPGVNAEFVKNLDIETFYSKEVSDDRARVIMENGEALEERLKLIISARERIVLSTFAFQSDESGKDVLCALLDAAERGVYVKILADGFNSWIYMEGNPYFYALSSMPNVEIKLYNKVNPLKPYKAMGRMHDKYILADDTAYIMGGRNTFNYFLGDYEGNKNHDWDVFVWNAVKNEKNSSVYQLESYFNNIFNREVCTLFYDSEKLSHKWSVRTVKSELKDRYAQMKETNQELFAEPDYAGVTYEVNKATLISNPTDISVKEPTVFYTLAQLMKNAEKNVYIHTPYVICNEMMYDSLKEIALHVPEFKLLTNSLENNGNMFAAGDYLLSKERLLDTGMEILEYEGGISYHGKCIAIDNDMSLIGSFNMDMRSVYLNTELMLAIHGEEFNKSLRQQMESYEDKAFKVIDADSYEGKAGMEKKKMPAIKLVLVKAIRFLTGWARFLL